MQTASKISAEAVEPGGRHGPDRDATRTGPGASWGGPGVSPPHSIRFYGNPPAVLVIFPIVC